MQANSCSKHQKTITYLCLAEQCSQDCFLCEECNKTPHKHSKTDIKLISDVKQSIKDVWQLKESAIQPYFSKVQVFYQNLRKQIAKLIDEDQRSVQTFLTKVKYHHLPYQANSQVYLQFIRDDYARLDKSSIITLINQAQNSQLNKHLDKQKQIINFLDVQLKKVTDKVLTLKYVLLSKKFQSQLLVPNLSQPSKAAYNDQFVKIYSFFNSRNLLIRLAKLVYRGSQNNFQAKSFYNCCNGISNCMAIVKTSNNKLVGGYSSLPLVHHDLDQLDQKGKFVEDKSKKSFIFNISALKSYSLKDSTKAIKYLKESAGPSFGQDLCINKVVTSNIGHSYECDKSIAVDSLQAKVHLLEAQKVDIKEFQVWQLSF